LYLSANCHDSALIVLHWNASWSFAATEVLSNLLFPKSPPGSQIALIVLHRNASWSFAATEVLSNLLFPKSPPGSQTSSRRNAGWPASTTCSTIKVVHVQCFLHI
jgi:hypothetical protein